MEAVITKSPHAIDPMRDQEPQKITRVNELSKPYTVYDVITLVYHRCFSSDLSEYFGKNPDSIREFTTFDGSVGLSRFWINECKVIRAESIFDQPKYDVKVDILVHTRCTALMVKTGNENLSKRYKFKHDFRLRYRFDLRPCHLECFFETAVAHEEDSLLNMYPDAIPMDKYFLPVLTDARQYRAIAEEMLRRVPGLLNSDEPIDPSVLIKEYGLTELLGKFDDKKVVGEYYFNVGNADVYDPETGEVKNTVVKPGTILINYLCIAIIALTNSGKLHELTHHRLAFYYLMLQKTHGHDYCSYLCKRQKNTTINDKWSPVDIMELHANRLPGFILIQDKPGRKYAAKLLESYGGKRTIQNMNGLVKDMAEHFQCPKSMAKTRLLDFGYTEVKGVNEFLGEKRIPNYISKLGSMETYTISEADAIREYTTNKEFQKVVDSGPFVYVEGHYCLFDSQYVRSDRYGNRYLTPHARNNMAECCLAFKTSYLHQPYVYRNGVLCKGSGQGRRRIEYKKPDGSSPVTAEGLALRRKIEKDSAEKRKYHMSFNDMTVKFMDEKEVSVPMLADMTGISEKTIKAMRNKADRQFAIGEIIAFCIALHLNPLISVPYLEISPCVIFDVTDIALYKHALLNWYMMEVAEVNRKLVESGADPLTPLVAGFDENGVMIEENVAL